MRVQELLAELRVRFWQHGESPHVTEGWLGIECPFCGVGTGRAGLGYNLRTGWMSCWKCGPHTLSEAIAAATGMDRHRVKELTGTLDRVRLPKDYERRGKLELPHMVTELQPAHRRYLERRGFDPDELADVWKLQGIGVAASLQWRIFIPIHQGGDVVSWTTRTIRDDAAPTDRYRGAKRHQEVVHRKNVLFGEDYARHGVVVHEGPFDVFATGPGAVCTAGTGFSRGQVRRLSRFPVRAICFDRDNAAQRRARALARMLECFPGETFCVRLDAKDAATATKGELRELRERFLV